MSNRDDENMHDSELDDDSIIEFEDTPSEVEDASIDFDTSPGDEDSLKEVVDFEFDEDVRDDNHQESETMEQDDVSNSHNDKQSQKQNQVIKYAIFGGAALMFGLAGFMAIGMLSPQDNGANSNSLIPAIPGSSATQPASEIKALNTPSNTPQAEVSPSKPDVNSVLNSLSGNQNYVPATPVKANPVPMDASNASVNMAQAATHNTDKPVESVNNQDFEALKEMTSEMRGVFEREFRVVNQKLDKGLNDAQEVFELKGEAESLRGVVSQLEADKALLDSKGKTQQESIAKLESLVKQAYEKILEYKKENASLYRKLNPIHKASSKKKVEDKETPASLGEWSIIGANESMVVVKSTSGESVMKNIGDSINGHKILKIDIQGNLIQTSGGYVTIP